MCCAFVGSLTPAREKLVGKSGLRVVSHGLQAKLLQGTPFYGKMVYFTTSEKFLVHWNLDYGAGARSLMICSSQTILYGLLAGWNLKLVKSAALFCVAALLLSFFLLELLYR